MDVAAGADEAASLQDLCDQHEAAILRYVLRFTDGDRGRAEDIVQETLVRAWRHPEGLDAARGDVRPWLFTIARRLAIDAHRARSARPAEVNDERCLAAVPAADEVNRTLDRIVVSDALAALTAEHRAVLVETYFQGRSVNEAAEVLGVPVGTVKSRTYYALRALKLALVERGVAT